MRQGLISLLGTWWRSNRGELEACRRELNEALEREAATSRELSEAQEQQTATSEVLRVISSSPTELQPVLDALVRTASRLCGADDVSIFRLESDRLEVVAHYGPLVHNQSQIAASCSNPPNTMSKKPVRFSNQACCRSALRIGVSGLSMI